MSIEKDFIVNYVVRREQEQAAQAESVAGYKAIEKQADATAKAVEADADREAKARKKATAEILTDEQAAAKAREELIKRDNANRVKALADAQDAEKKAREDRKAAEKESREADRKAAKERTERARKEADEKRQAAREARDLEVQANKVAAQARRDRAEAERQARKQSLTEEGVAEKAKEELIRRENAARVKALADAGDATKKEAATSAMAASAASKFAGVLTSIGGAVYGIQGLQSVVSALADSFARAKAEAQANGKVYEDLRASLKEIAFLKGQGAGPDSTTVRADIDFRKQTLQDASNARQVQEAFMNKAAISTDSDSTRAKMTREDARAAMVYAGQQQSQFGGSGEAFGSLAGMIPSMERAPRVSSSDIIRRMAQLNAIGQIGSANPGQFAGQIAASSSLASTGAYRDAARMAAVGSTISFASPGEIATGLDQIHRATMGALTNQEKPKGSAMAPAEYMKKLGANDQMDDLDILKLMFADMAKAEADRNAKGEQFNIATYLNEKGYGDQRERDRIRDVYARRNDLFGPMMRLAEAPPSLADATAPFGEFRQTVQGQKQAADLTQERARLAMGGGAQEYYARLEQQAFAAMQANNEAWGGFDDYKGTNALRAKMAEILRQEGKARGLDYGLHVGPSSGVGYASVSDPLRDLMIGQAGGQTAAEAFYKRGIEIKQAGGDPMGANSQIVKDQQRELERIADSLDRSERALTGINQKMNPAPVATVAPGGRNNGLAH